MTTRIRLTRWDESLCLRIPKDVANHFGLTEGCWVEVEAAGDGIVVRADRPCHDLQDLLSEMTPDAMRDVFDWGPDVGREDVP